MTSKIDSTEYSHPLHKRVFYPTTGNAQLQSTSFNTKSGIAHGSSLKYHSRKARKGRYALKTHHIEHHAPAPGKIAAEPTGLQLRVKTVESEFKPHLKLDISFWLAVTFVLGSIVWVINGFTVMLPLYLGYINENDTLDTVYYKTSAALAFIGGTIFEVGSYLMVAEALNRGRETGFGESVSHLLQTGHKFPETASLAGSDVSEKGHASRTIGLPKEERGFVWWGKPLWRDLGYDAALVQLFAATVFWISTITGLPGVIPGFPTGGSKAIIDVFFWSPQVLGGTGFIISSLILMIEVQKKWYLPNLKDLGWHIGFWNLVGSFGFMICGAMGYSTQERWVKNSAISTFWGSWGFLIGSAAQLYEAVWREKE